MSVNFPAEEATTLKHWREIDAFQTQLKLSQGKKPYTFYDGPPFATGLPHYGHLLASTIKDIIPRYWSMKGHHVQRRFGWDTHGLPIEYEIDKKFGTSAQEYVKEKGIASYNAECKAIVMTYAQEWRETIDRLGRWIDFDNDYKTMNVSFMESVWWVFKQLFDKGLVYRSYRVVPFSTALGTPLSQHEASQNYKETQDPAVIVAFPLLDDKSTSLLAWTTTPWTLPSNTALAVHPDYEYIKIKDEASGNTYIIQADLLKTLYKDPKKAKFQVLDRFNGKHMEGWKYEPLFNYFYEEFKDRAFKVLLATYVTKDDGVGIVHQAPSFGEDDFNVGKKNGTFTTEHPPPNPVDAQGRFTKEVPDFAGQHVKEADKAIIKHLKSIGRLVKDGQITHNYPFCWRSDTPLIYRGIPAWYINITGNEKNESIIPLMLEGIEKSHWVPDFVKTKRFADWIKNARDWNVSRNRYWGTPMPLWCNEDFSEIVAVGSIEELQALSGYKGEINDLHRDKIDDITIPGKDGKGALRRIDEVFDCWFESGSMPYASSHYPFENKDYFESTFPGDFIAEGLDQTRGWFYTLVVLGVHLRKILPFKNVIVNGIVQAADGKKMSKRLKNYPDPVEVIDKYGADALRLYMINSPVVKGEELRFKEAGVKEIVSKVLLPLYNSYNFFKDQVNLLKKFENVDFTFDPKAETSNTNVMDKWILASTQTLLEYVNDEMAAYRLYTVVPGLLELLEDTTNWYIKFNRKRFKGELGRDDTLHALNTLFEVLFTLVRALAPFTPFITDMIYQRLLPYIPQSLHSEDMRSVHFLPFPEVRSELKDPVVERRISRMRNVIELVRQSRERRTVSLRTPLKTLVVIHNDQQYLDDIKSLEGYITEELNIRDLVLSSDESKYNVQYSVALNFQKVGKKLRGDAKKVQKALLELNSQDCKGYLGTGKITVAGVSLEEGDLIVKRGLPQDDASQTQETNSDNEVLTILDVAVYPELAQEGVAREIIARVQQLRKKAGLKTTDDVKMEYRVKADPSNIGLETCFVEQTKFIEKALRRPVDKHVVTEVEPLQNGVKEDVIAEEEQEVQDACFLLRLVRL
ncbi:isoleucine--tRNA ligase [Neophaeococcomyces mojaviensis]|uniref:Isoleucine--tRNA ligase n=1 Tax=Neophaeococcomyces mojaviensis TaxID=3383035 RepID=A0ACC3A3R6_9EURO|nr:isoleucine--tRNA ligase [Knufia sp. JES_112]